LDRERAAPFLENGRSVGIFATSTIEIRECLFLTHFDFDDEQSERPLASYTGQSTRTSPMSPLVDSRLSGEGR
jgi:hypothetical protein